MSWTRDRNMTSGRKNNSRFRGAVACAACAAALALSSGGCQHRPPPKEPADPPVIIDGAMERRVWPQTPMYYTDTRLKGWPTRFPYTEWEVSNPLVRQRAYVLDTLAFVGQIILMPFTYINDPPFANKWFAAAQYDPTYTAMPAPPPGPPPADASPAPSETIARPETPVNPSGVNTTDPPGSRQPELPANPTPPAPPDRSSDNHRPDIGDTK